VFPCAGRSPSSESENGIKRDSKGFNGNGNNALPVIWVASYLEK